MEAGQGRSAWWRPSVWPGLLLWLPVGCALCRPPIDLAIPTDGSLAARRENRAGVYTLHCPDVLDVTVEAHPELTGQRAIGPDGRVDLDTKGRLRVEGCTVGEAAHLLAQVAGVPPEAVQVRVAQYKSQHLYLLGQIAGFQRVVAYQGPETVVDLLHRVGGITAGAAQDDVRVIRSHISEGKPPEVVRVDLQAILLRHDARTNIYLRPQDQIYVGETREFSLSKCIPPWLRPIYETLCGMRRAGATQRDGMTG
jgi:protein involved in polysaccharide export with SLBB domain